MKEYSARDYLAAVEPWLLEDASAGPGIIESDVRLAHEVAQKLSIPIDTEGNYPLCVWLGVHRRISKAL
jgi:hypothetical protein